MTIDSKDLIEHNGEETTNLWLIISKDLIGDEFKRPRKIRICDASTYVDHEMDGQSVMMSYGLAPVPPCSVR